MGIITGYLTIPNLDKKEFSSRVGTLEKLGLETRLFGSGVRRGELVGPNGVLFSGKANMGSTKIMEMMYGSGKPNEMQGLTYDVSSSHGDEDFDVRGLSFDDFGSYFSLRVKIEKDRDRILDFNKNYLQPQSWMGFRFVEPGYVAYEYLTDRDNLDSEMEKAKKSLIDVRFKLDERETTIICDYFKVK